MCARKCSIIDGDAQKTPTPAKDSLSIVCFGFTFIEHYEMSEMHLHKIRACDFTTIKRFRLSNVFFYLTVVLFVPFTPKTKTTTTTKSIALFITETNSFRFNVVVFVFSCLYFFNITKLETT